MTGKVAVMIIAIAALFMLLSGAASADYQTEHKTLRYGMYGNRVSNLQDDLKSLGYFNYGSTGYFGNITLQAVLDYQRDESLWVDGIVGPATAGSLKADTVLKTARRYLGVPYVWGGVSPSGFDCSGFTHYVLLKNDIIVPRTAAAQYTVGDWADKSRLRPGDLVFFSTYKAGASHVGIYMGGGKFIHASSGAGEIIISDLGATYYKEHYIGARRAIR